MLKKTVLPSILIADDDEDDRMFAEDALRESFELESLDFVEDGEELMDYLHQRAQYEGAPRPGLIILDLNMPRKDGREALREIKNSPSLRQIPVVVMTTSHAEEDIYSTYDLGVNSFVTKPVTFRDLVEMMKAIGTYWFGLVELPSK